MQVDEQSRREVERQVTASRLTRCACGLCVGDGGQWRVLLERCLCLNQAIEHKLHAAVVLWTCRSCRSCQSCQSHRGCGVVCVVFVLSFR